MYNLSDAHGALASFDFAQGPGSWTQGFAPLTLVTLLELEAVGESSSGGIRPGNGQTVLNFSLAFFEADQVTPVNIFENAAAVPEPATWALLGGSLVGFSGLKKRFRPGQKTNTIV